MHRLTNGVKLIFLKSEKVDSYKPEILVVMFSVVAGPNPLEVDARIES